jgi:hypothetical protein
MLRSNPPATDNEPYVPRRPQDAFEPGRHKANARLAGALLAPALLAIAVAAWYAGTQAVQSHVFPDLGPAAFIVAAFFLASSVATPVAILREGRIEEEEDDRCKRECDELDKALNHIDDKVLSGLAKSNFKQMRMFTVVALRQARMSYYVSVAAASLALLVLVSGGAATIVLAGIGAKVTAASLTAVGAALGSFVSTTFLRTYWIAARQMSYYYGQPLVHCYLLHAEWLALMLAEHPERKADPSIWKQVLEASIQAAETAQAHLLTMQDVSLSRAMRMPNYPTSFGLFTRQDNKDCNHDQ